MKRRHKANGGQKSGPQRIVRPREFQEDLDIVRGAVLLKDENEV